MPKKVEEKGGPGPTAASGRAAAAQLMAELRQPLTAASNYIGTARVILGSSRDSQAETAVRKLDMASQQILRAGEILSQLRHELGENEV